MATSDITQLMPNHPKLYLELMDLLSLPPVWDAVFDFYQPKMGWTAVNKMTMRQSTGSSAAGRNLWTAILNASSQCRKISHLVSCLYCIPEARNLAARIADAYDYTKSSAAPPPTPTSAKQTVTTLAELKVTFPKLWVTTAEFLSVAQRWRTLSVYYLLELKWDPVRQEALLASHDHPAEALLEELMFCSATDSVALLVARLNTCNWGYMAERLAAVLAAAPPAPQQKDDDDDDDDDDYRGNPLDEVVDH